MADSIGDMHDHDKRGHGTGSDKITWRKAGSAAERRQSIARGVSPWGSDIDWLLSPGGAIVLPPLRGSSDSSCSVSRGSRPWLLTAVPSGLNSAKASGKNKFTVALTLSAG